MDEQRQVFNQAKALAVLLYLGDSDTAAQLHEHRQTDVFRGQDLSGGAMVA